MKAIDIVMCDSCEHKHEKHILRQKVYFCELGHYDYFNTKEYCFDYVNKSLVLHREINHG